LWFGPRRKTIVWYGGVTRGCAMVRIEDVVEVRYALGFENTGMFGAEYARRRGNGGEWLCIQLIDVAILNVVERVVNNRQV